MEVDLRVGRREARRLSREDERFSHRSAASEWVLARVATDADLRRVAALFRAAAAEHAPPRGTSARPPPSEAELAARRRLHGEARPEDEARSLFLALFDRDIAGDGGGLGGLDARVDRWWASHRRPPRSSLRDLRAALASRRRLGRRPKPRSRSSTRGRAPAATTTARSAPPS